MRLRPSIPVGAIAALGVAFAMLATLVYFVYTDLTPLYVPPFNPNPDQLSATVIAIGALLCGLAAGWAMYRRRERVPALLAWSVTLSAASLFAYLAGQIRSYNGFEMEDYASTATTMVPDTRVAALGLALLVLALPVLALLLGEGRTRTWFLRGASSDTRLIAAATFAYRRPLSWLRVLVAPVVVWLAIPLPAAGAGRGGRRITPGEWQFRTGIRLRFVYRRGRTALLVADEARVRKRGTVARKGGRRRQRDGILPGAQTVPVFLLVPQVTLQKRLNLYPAAERIAKYMAMGFTEVSFMARFGGISHSETMTTMERLTKEVRPMLGLAA